MKNGGQRVGVVSAKPLRGRPEYTAGGPRTSAVTGSTSYLVRQLWPSPPLHSNDAGSKPQLSGSATSPLGDAHCLMTVRSISASLAGETQALGVRKICCVVQVNQDGSHPSPGAPTTAPSKSSG